MDSLGTWWQHHDIRDEGSKAVKGFLQQSRFKGLEGWPCRGSIPRPLQSVKVKSPKAEVTEPLTGIWIIFNAK